MSKVLVVDCCRNCPSARLYELKPLCWIADKMIESPSEIADWCPLPDLPDERYEENFDWTDLTQKENAAMNHGWNKCLKTILREVEV